MLFPIKSYFEVGPQAELLIRDEEGPLLLASDGATRPGGEWVAFRLEQEDGGGRNRRNQPGDLNNFWLRISHAGESVRLMHGQQGRLGDYRVMVFWSTARVGDVLWLEAPYEIVTYLIYRQ